MTHQDRISIIITFVCGFFVGGYLYLTGFLPTYHLPEASTKDVYEGLVVVADTYGGCKDLDTCLSFQLLSDRSYRAVLGVTAEAQIYDGTVSRSSMNGLLTTIDEAILTANAVPLNEVVCHYTSDGASNFRFLITYNGNNYTLDTCLSSIDYDAPLWQALRVIYTEIAEARN